MEPTKTDTLEKPTPEKPAELVLPKVENPIFQYDDKTHTFWLGIPVERTEPFMASCILDSMKMTYFEIFSRYVAEKRSKIEVQQPGVLNNLRKHFLMKNKKV
jgi:hypothetical protein